MKRKWVERINDSKNVMNRKLLYIGMMLVSSPAFALGSDDTIRAALNTVIGWLTDDIGLAAGTLAVIGAGFAGLTGRMPIAYLKTIGISLGIIYSAAYLANMIIG